MPPKKRLALSNFPAVSSAARRSTRSTTPVYKEDDWQDKPEPVEKQDEHVLDDTNFLVNRLSRMKLEEILLGALKDPGLTRERLERKVVDGLPRPLRNMKRKKLEVITWRGVERAGMGVMGKVPGELIVEILNYLPFRERLRMVILVSKGFLGLMHERSLWRDVENTRQIDGVVLAGMISPTMFGGSLLPVGCIRVLSIDLDYCSAELVVQIMRRLHLQKHPLASLSIKGTRKKMAAALAALLKQAQGPRTSTQINFGQITKFVVGSDYNNNPAFEVFRKLLDFMPNLSYLDVSHGVSFYFTHVEYQRHPIATLAVFTEISRSGELLRASASHVSHNYLRTLYLPSWSASLSALGQMGAFFPELERLKVGMIGLRENENVSMSLMPRLRYFEVSGYSSAVKENDLSQYFIDFIAYAPAIEELSFSNLYIPGRKYDLFKAAKSMRDQNPIVFKKLNSPELKKVNLEGWVIDFACISGEKKVWDCPKLVDGKLKGCNWEKESVYLDGLGAWKWLPADDFADY